jgi:hypothetical protein
MTKGIETMSQETNMSSTFNLADSFSCSLQGGTALAIASCAGHETSHAGNPGLPANSPVVDNGVSPRTR